MGHGWPYYAQNLWLATPGSGRSGASAKADPRSPGLAAVLYAPCAVIAKVGDGTEVTITEDTRYPFEEQVAFNLATPKPVTFPLYLRVPGWCDGPRVSVNGEALSVEARPRSYIVITREWSDGDRVTLELPMEVTLTRWTENLNSVSVNRGPLTYSLKIGERYVREGGTDDWPAWEIHPTTPWNYGLVLDPDDPAGAVEVVQGNWPDTDMPFEANAAPVELRARAKRIPNWQLDHLGLVGKMQPSPVQSDEPVETIPLIPMGCARLRLAVFPVIGDGPDAREWALPPPPMASHCHGSDTVEALTDGLVPKHSHDQSIPRFTWWDHKGSREWVQCNLDARKTVSAVEVYWFDDTGAGQCRVPKSWRLLHQVGADWRPVANPDNYSIEKDRFNRTTFDPVQTDAFRLEARLQPDFSAGVLELRVE